MVMCVVWVQVGVDPTPGRDKGMDGTGTVEWEGKLGNIGDATLSADILINIDREILK